MFNSIMSEISNIIFTYSIVIGTVISIISLRFVLFYAINTYRLVRIHLRRPSSAGYEWNGKTYIDKGRNSYDQIVFCAVGLVGTSAIFGIGIKLIML